MMRKRLNLLLALICLLNIISIPPLGGWQALNGSARIRVVLGLGL